MNRLATIAATLALTLPLAVSAQTTAPRTAPLAPAPAEKAMPAQNGAQLTLSEEQARNWLKKSVYSSDGKNLGEVEVINRDANGRVTEIHADIGGFLGIGETRVRVMPSQFRLEGDRVVLNIPADQAKTLPTIAK